MLIGLIGEAPIIHKYILDPAATFPFRGDTNDITGRGCRTQRWSIHRGNDEGFKYDFLQKRQCMVSGHAERYQP